MDWITFTMTMRYKSSYPESMKQAQIYASAVEETFLITFGDKLTAAAFGGNWEKNERSRAPYTDSWKLGEAGITLFASPTLTHCCVEVSGQGCETMLSNNTLYPVLEAISGRVTRIDIATDIETDERPPQFVKNLNHKRMTASGYQKSASGETCYVGSQKSDRYARVYRYNAPHPRSHLLRIECVFRKAYAKRVAQACLDADMDSVRLSAWRAFGFSYAANENMGVGNVDLSITSADRSVGKTVYWLVNSCAPAFKKLVESGGITDPEQFINRYFLSQ